MLYNTARGTVDAFKLSQSIVIRDPDGKLQVGYAGDYLGITVGNGNAMSIMSAAEMGMLPVVPPIDFPRGTDGTAS